MSFAKVFAQQSRTWILAEMAICAGIIAVLDLISGTEIRLLPFYAGPIFVAGWF